MGLAEEKKLKFSLQVPSYRRLCCAGLAGRFFLLDFLAGRGALSGVCRRDEDHQPLLRVRAAGERLQHEGLQVLQDCRHEDRLPLDLRRERAVLPERRLQWMRSLGLKIIFFFEQPC